MQTHTWACTQCWQCGMGAAHPPAHRAAPLQPTWDLRGGSSSAQPSAVPLVCAQLSPGICMGGPVGCPNTSHSSRVLHGAPAVPGAVGEPFPSPLWPQQMALPGCWPCSSKASGSRFLSHCSVPAPSGPASSTAGWATSPLALPKEQAPWTRCYPMAPEAMVMGTLEQASQEGPVVSATSLG